MSTLICFALKEEVRRFGNRPAQSAKGSAHSAAFLPRAGINSQKSGAKGQLRAVGTVVLGVNGPFLMKRGANPTVFGQNPMVRGANPAVGGGKVTVGGANPIIGGAKVTVGFAPPAVGFAKVTTGFDAPTVGFGKVMAGFAPPTTGFASPAAGFPCIGRSRQRPAREWLPRVWPDATLAGFGSCPQSSASP